MRVFAIVLALSLTLMAGPTYAQAAAQQPAAPAPAQDQPLTPPKPVFQAGLKYGYVRIDLIAAASSEGKALNAKVQALQDQKTKELNDKNKQLQASMDRLEKTGSVMSDQARNQLQIEIERQQRDIQRFTEDAQQDLQTLSQQLQVEFERKVLPAIDKVAKDKGVHFVFNAGDSGLVWADPSMELTAEVIAELDAAAKAGK